MGATLRSIQFWVSLLPPKLGSMRMSYFEAALNFEGCSTSIHFWIVLRDERKLAPTSPAEKKYPAMFLSDSPIIGWQNRCKCCVFNRSIDYMSSNERNFALVETSPNMGALLINPILVRLTASKLRAFLFYKPETVYFRNSFGT